MPKRRPMTLSSAGKEGGLGFFSLKFSEVRFSVSDREPDSPWVWVFLDARWGRPSKSNR